jgi:hypothetical protein
MAQNFLRNILSAAGTLPWLDNLFTAGDEGGSSFLPSSLANLHAWYKSDAGVTVSTDRVTDWADQSGNSRNLEQTTGTHQPLLVTADQNGLDVIHYDNVDEHLEGADMGVLNAPFTVFVLSKFDQASQGAGDLEYIFNIENGVGIEFAMARRAVAGGDTDKIF